MKFLSMLMMMLTLAWTPSYSADSLSLEVKEKQEISLPKTFVTFDGGGERGIYSLKIIKKIEEKLDAPLTKYCDFFSGTSTGGLIALGYASGKTTQDMLDLYINHGKDIFSRTFWHKVVSLDGLIAEKYDTAPLQNEIIKFFGADTKLTDLTHGNVIIPSTNITKDTVMFFDSLKARNKTLYNYRLWEVARATSAAPTYFQPVDFHGEALADGGLVANNPTLVAGIVAESYFGFDWRKKTNVISVGTGCYTSPITYASDKYNGLIEWASPISDVIMSTTSHMFADLSQLYYSSGRYIRLNGKLDENLPLDGFSPLQIKKIEEAAEKYIESHPEAIDKAVQLLRD
jgi:predicted acylesterase/phospholipase RssA